MRLEFTKMHGCGNDYIYLDCFEKSPPDDAPALARTLSRRHFSVGSDGLVVVCPSERKGALARMRMWNADGSEAEMCGNAIRCVAKLLHERGHVRATTIPIETGNGVLDVSVVVDRGTVVRARVAMGTPRVEAAMTVAGARGIPVNVGNPHFVLFDESLADERVLGLGPRIERDRAFPKRTNVEFVAVESRTRIRARVWERGSGETLACGTGACAVLAAARTAGLADDRATIVLPGGELECEWPGGQGVIYLSGPCETAFSGWVEV
jgi:diaminopimelate epimerase